MTETAVSLATSGAEDDQTSAPIAPRETPNDSGVQRDGSGGPVPNLCPGLGDETDAALTLREDVPTHDDPGHFAPGRENGERSERGAQGRAERAIAGNNPLSGF